MQQYQFESMGTIWTVLIDTNQVPSIFWKELEAKTISFEQQYSRFIDTSEVMHLATKPAGKYQVSQELAQMLQLAQELKLETNGMFDPAIGELLEKSGYDAQYSFTPDLYTADWQPVEWSITDQIVTVDKRCVFDVGGFGKGYWIDRLCEFIEKAGFQHYLVDGGGDMRGTTKKSLDAWNIAIEIPGKPDQAASIVALQHQALAVSDTYKRQWHQDWHHVIDPIQKTSTTNSVGCSVIAKTATIADAMTTCFMLTASTLRQQLSEKYHAEYLLFITQEKMVKSARWPGELLAIPTEALSE